MLLTVYCAVLLFLYADGTSIKGLYCKDPDTGKLYPVNAMWQSESFCGNYTCKLRKKNITQTEYTPLKRINITHETLKNQQLFDDMFVSPSQHTKNVMKNVESQQPVFHKDLMTRVNELTSENKSDEKQEKDRYLTESEINRITEILHTVRKSDLEAIIEIYSLAQDIYKEMDTTTESIIEGTETTKKDSSDKKEVKEKIKNDSQESVSYWYEPLHHHTVKVKPTDTKIDESNPSPTLRSYPHPATYFKGDISDKEFGKLPYYYPISNFQRMSSYLHSKSPYVPRPYLPPPIERRPCNKEIKNLISQPWYGPQIPQRITPPEMHRPREMQLMQPMLLPYPFSYVNHYNYSSYPASFYYNNYPWAQLDIYNRHRNNPHGLDFGTYQPQMPKTEIIANKEESEERKEDPVKVDEDKMESVENDGEKKSPVWKTDQLSTKILDEVKANILEKSKLLKPLSIGKNIKLEKVGKVIKLDELSRPKRDTDGEKKDIDNLEKVLFEAYIEKKTCESSVEPGFFTYGNASEPFPACCPRRISVDING